MGIIKRKKKKNDMEPPKPPAMELDLAMHNTTTVQADEHGDVCVALFQTEKALAPAEWQMLAEKARQGSRFMLLVIDKDE